MLFLEAFHCTYKFQMAAPSVDTLDFFLSLGTYGLDFCALQVCFSLMFLNQRGGTYHQKCRTNAINKNEGQVKLELLKRKTWSSCLSEI